MNSKDIQISCILPAYNEAPRIESIINLLLEVDQIKEIVVVDDGSTDGTKIVVRSILT